MSTGNPENLADVLEEMNSLKFDPKKKYNPLEPACIEVFDKMKRVVAGVSESRFKPKSVRELGCMLENVTGLYSSQVDYCKQFAVEVRSKVCRLSPDPKLLHKAVVVIERSSEVEQRAANLRKLQNESARMSNARVVLTPLREGDLEKYHQLGILSSDPANSSIQSVEVGDLSLGGQEIGSSGCDCMDESGLNIENENGPRRSTRIRKRLMGPTVCGCAKNYNRKRFISKDGRQNIESAVPQVDHEMQVDPLLELEPTPDEFEDADGAKEPQEIFSCRVDQIKRKFSKMELVSCHLQNNDGVPLDEFRQNVLERRRKIVQAYVEVIKSFDEPKIVDLLDAKANEFNARIPTPVDDTADKKYQFKLLEAIYKENAEIIEIETNANKENSNAFGESEVDSGLYDDTEVMGIPSFNIMSPSGHNLISETPQGSPDSIDLEDSAYETQESSHNSPMGDKDEVRPVTGGTPADKDEALQTPRFVDFNTIFKKLLDKEDNSAAAVTRCAYWLTDLLSKKLVNMNMEPLRSESNERSLSDMSMTIEANNLDESMSKLGSVCPSVVSMKKRGVLQVNITPSGVQHLKQDSLEARQTEENDKIIEDEEVTTTFFEQKKGRNSIVRPCIANNSPQKTVMRELQPLRKRKLLFDSDNDKC